MGTCVKLARGCASVGVQVATKILRAEYSVLRTP